MPNVVSVKFRGSYKTYYFAPSDVQGLLVNDQVIVETARGREMAQVVHPSLEVDQSAIVGELKPVVRRASTTDLLDAQNYRQMEAEACIRCREQVVKISLPMKIVSAEYSYDGANLTFFFTSEQRVDFRELVRELARIFRTRIELRQIGVRDEAKTIGGVGKCGRPLCCSTWLPEFCPVSIRMAKQQDLPLSPIEISGCCGRLLCCLAYENDQYAEVKAQFPKVGKSVQISCGLVKVLKVDALSEMATVLLEDGTVRQLTAAQVSGDAPLDCPDEESLTDDQREALDEIVPTVTLRPVPTRVASVNKEPAVERTPRPQPRNVPVPISNSQRREVRPVQEQGQRRRPLPEQPVQPRPEKILSTPVVSSAADSSTEDVDTEERRKRRRGGRHRPRRGRRSPDESASSTAAQDTPGAD
ncbi:MAG: PSP1 domain-containing protein [Anaerolineae bacterium]